MMCTCVQVRSLETPRKIIMMVKAGLPVDATLVSLLECVEANDIIVDGGNEFYAETQKRTKLAAERGVR